jgi:hypothetical protein
LKLPDKIRSFAGRELAFYQWAHDKFYGPAVPEPEQSRLVEFINASGQTSKDMSRVWWDAVARWLSQPYTVAKQVEWQQRECIDKEGHLGKDAAECEQQGIEAKMLPVVRFYGAGYPFRGQSYLGESSAQGLLGFAERLNRVDMEDRLSSDAYDSPPQMLGYFQGAMKRPFEEASALWSQDAASEANPVVEWKVKECTDDVGHPGRDYQECVDQRLEQLPTVRFVKPAGAEAVDNIVEYDFADLSRRKADRLVDFARQQVGLPSGDAKMAASGNDDVSSEKASIDKEAAENTQLASEGFDHRLVSYYAAAGPRSKRFEGAVAEASDLWTKATDPDADAMFMAALKKSDAKRGFAWTRGRTDPPFIWWEQRECYDRMWRPGKDYAMCQRHKVQVPSLHLYTLPEEPPLDGAQPEVHGGVLPSVEFRGPRTVNGVVDFLRRETGVDKYMQNQQEFMQAMLGSEGPDENALTEQETAVPDHHAQAGTTAAAADKLYSAVNVAEMQTMAPLVCLAAAVIPKLALKGQGTGVAGQRRVPAHPSVASFL